jgi:hypothetical protein
MEESRTTSTVDIESIVQKAVQEYMHQDTTKKEPAYKAELQEERRRREQLERRLNEVVAESKKNRMLAQEAERSSAIRSELQQLGVTKLDIAYKAVQDSIFRSEDGRLVAKTEGGEVPAKEYLTGFVTDNPEFLPARISGGSGITGNHKAPLAPSGIDIDKISPAMDKSELERVRQEILRVASQSLRIT